MTKKKTIKKAERYLTKSKIRVVTKTTKVKKKEAPKASFTKHIIKAKVLGKNLVMWVGNTKFAKPNVGEKELKSIENKIKIYNKVPTKARLEELLKFFESVSKSLKEAKAKGLKKIIKKEKKKNPKEKPAKKEEVVKREVEEKVGKSLSYEEMVKLEAESIRLSQVYKGYKHPVTGRTWNGERYV